MAAGWTPGSTAGALSADPAAGARDPAAPKRPMRYSSVKKCNGVNFVNSTEQGEREKSRESRILSEIGTAKGKGKRLEREIISEARLLPDDGRADDEVAALPTDTKGSDGGGERDGSGDELLLPASEEGASFSSSSVSPS